MFFSYLVWSPVSPITMRRMSTHRPIVTIHIIIITIHRIRYISISIRGITTTIPVADGYGQGIFLHIYISIVGIGCAFGTMGINPISDTISIENNTNRIAITRRTRTGIELSGRIICISTESIRGDTKNSLQGGRGSKSFCCLGKSAHHRQAAGHHRAKKGAAVI